MHPPLGVDDARMRVLVRLPDGRTATLTYWPPPSGRARPRGSKARVRLTSGRYMSVAPSLLARVVD
jgi:hypothetical protein